MKSRTHFLAVGHGGLVTGVFETLGQAKRHCSKYGGWPRIEEWSGTSKLRQWARYQNLLGRTWWDKELPF